MNDPSPTPETDHMRWLDAHEHDAECRRYPTGWLCTTTCPVPATPPGVSGG